MRGRAVRQVSVLVVVGALVVSGCSDQEEPADEAQAGEQAQEQAQEQVQEQGQTAGSAAEETDADGGTASGAGVAAFDPQDVLVEQTVAFADDPEDEVTLGVQSLTVEGDVMVLRMVVTPDLASVPDDDSVSLFAALEESGFRPTLVDRENLTEYSLVSEGGTTWSSDAVQTSARNGSPLPVWGVFAPPQDDIDVVDLRIRDVWPEFTDIPITR